MNDIVLTAGETRELDHRTIETLNRDGKSGSVLLMSWAALQLFKSISSASFFSTDSRFLILAGKGNNGGDAYALAWFLYTSFPSLSIQIFADDLPSTDDARYFRELITTAAPSIEINGTKDFPDPASLTKSDVVVDGLLGTGFRGELAEEWNRFFEPLASSPAIKVAIDIPSGVPADGDFFDHNAFPADYTVTFAAAKPGLLIEPGIHFSGKVIIAPAGFLQTNSKKTFLQEKKIPPLRIPYGHKYTSGTLHLLGGSEEMEGAAVMSARSFLETGGGLARVYSSSPKIHAALKDVPEIMLQPSALEEKSEKFFESLNKEKQVIVIGPGLSEELPVTFMQKLCSLSVKLLFDGSALRHLNAHREICAKHQLKALVLTPHSGEASALIPEIGEKNVRNMALAIAEKYQAIVYHKGYGGILTDGEKEVYPRSHAYQLATGGSGDIFSGVAASMLLRTENSFEAIEMALQVYNEAAEKALPLLSTSLAPQDRIRSTNLLDYL